MDLATKLGLPCKLSVGYAPSDISESVDHFIATEVFGVSPYDDAGQRRHFGVYANPGADDRAVFWIITVISGRPVSVHSDYDVMLLSIEKIDFIRENDSMYTFIVHPVPVSKLQECLLFPPPYIWASNDDGDIDLEVIRRTLTGHAHEIVWIDPWSPYWRYDKNES